MKCPYETAEDVLMKVDKFVILVNFVVLDMKEDFKVPLILGRLVLATRKSIPRSIMLLGPLPPLPPAS